MAADGDHASPRLLTMICDRDSRIESLAAVELWPEGLSHGARLLEVLTAACDASPTQGVIFNDTPIGIITGVTAVLVAVVGIVAMVALVQWGTVSPPAEPPKSAGPADENR